MCVITAGGGCRTAPCARSPWAGRACGAWPRCCGGVDISRYLRICVSRTTRCGTGAGRWARPVSATTGRRSSRPPSSPSPWGPTPSGAWTTTTTCRSGRMYCTVLHCTVLYCTAGQDGRGATVPGRQELDERGRGLQEHRSQRARPRLGRGHH